MKIKGLIDEDFLQYKKPSMFIITATCSFKCEKDANCPGMCQNSSLAWAPIIDADNKEIVKRFLSNNITEAVVFGGLEPFDQKQELCELVQEFRKVTLSDIIVYTGYTENELTNEVRELQKYPNIIIKFGRYIPNQPSYLDEVLGVMLASSNQYAKQIS